MLLLLISHLSLVSPIIDLLNHRAVWKRKRQPSHPQNGLCRQLNPIIKLVLDNYNIWWWSRLDGLLGPLPFWQKQHSSCGKSWLSTVFVFLSNSEWTNTFLAAIGYKICLEEPFPPNVYSMQQYWCVCRLFTFRKKCLLFWAGSRYAYFCQCNGREQKNLQQHKRWFSQVEWVALLLLLSWSEWVVWIFLLACLHSYTIGRHNGRDFLTILLPFQRYSFVQKKRVKTVI